MAILIWIIIATTLTSIISLVGAVALILKESILKKITIPLVAMSAGALLGGALLHLIPESLEEAGDVSQIMIWVLSGFILFLILEQFIHWHHCHKMPSEHKHPVTYLILISDAIHNFIDGITIGAAFLVNTHLGLIATLAVAAHEIPQELGDFGILIHGGWKKSKALLYNFFSGLTMILGGIVVWLISSEVEILFLLPFAAGNFIYIASSDLIPEFKGSGDFKKNILNFSFFLLGLFLMYGLTFLEIGHHH